ncbi:putative protein gravitropic in the light 1 [Arabidopsis thaliana]|uniref:DUF641 domain-containing protein n=2 Tax=Arabidopsis TaxID=3701 RepID=A0A8T2G470_ARASU|nr:hypothetical protein ISN45_At02g026490 [Arabidopsis thaliana x Arabidopsis arenosa]KAG7642799.1 hypothetical protein ISN44_As02g026760 [Arabidopsis suecica]
MRKVSSNNGVGVGTFKSQNPNFDDEDDDGDCHFKAVVAKIFASTTSIKAAYAELQRAQSPYDSDAIQAADTVVVNELKTLSELKRSFMRKELNLSPKVAIMLAEIHEQQSLMRTYEIAMKRLEFEVTEKKVKIDELKMNLEENLVMNKSLEKKLTAT